MHLILPTRMLLAAVLLAAAAAAAQTPPAAAAGDAPAIAAAAAPEGAAPQADRRYVLVEEFTGATLGGGEIKLGTDLELGLSDRFMMGTDAVALAVGATTLSVKGEVYRAPGHLVALGLRLAYLSKDTLLWGNVNEHFEVLDARVARPSVSWTHALSPRLNLHTFWAKGFGLIKARLSEKGRRKLWETKHPDADYDARDRRTQAPAGDGGTEDNDETDANQEKTAAGKSAYTSQSVQVQSIMGLAQERFQMTGELARANGNKVLLTSRIEQSSLETLQSKVFGLTAAHQWIWTNFQMRLGVGLKYYTIAGRDLDAEELDESGVMPASDIVFYWRF